MTPGLIDSCLKKTEKVLPKSNIYVSDIDFIRCLLRDRPQNSHKGVFGHALLIAGKIGMAGAAILSARACLKSGVGLLTIHTPECNRIILQTTVPESTLNIDLNEHSFSTPLSVNRFQAVGIGPGLGMSDITSVAFKTQLEIIDKPLVLDADSLNIMARARHLLSILPRHTVITPHQKELDRLTTESNSFEQRLQKALELTRIHDIIVVLKGAPTIILSPGDICHVNTTGNSGMSTGGSGDILTGIILSLLSQGYDPMSASILSVFAHGMAGDMAAEHKGQIGMIASDIVEEIPEVWSMIYG